MSTTATAVYYQRTLDPDNTEPEYGSFVTNNSIVYQLPDAGNKVMVSAVSTYDSTAFLGLGTKDCRAVCFIIAASLTTSPNTLDVLWGGTASGYYYTAGSYYSADVGIGLVYNLGDIRAGDSTDLTYAYILRAADLDSALEFTSPTAVVNSTILHSGADTVSACTLLTDSLPVSISNGEFYTWLWAPTIGLSSDTGTFNYV